MHFQPASGFLEWLTLIAEPREVDCASPLDFLNDFSKMSQGVVKGTLRFEGPLCGSAGSCAQWITAANNLDATTLSDDHYYFPNFLSYVSANRLNGITAKQHCC